MEVLIVLICLIFSVLPVLAFREGVKVGMGAKEGKVPEPVRIPKIFEKMPDASTPVTDKELIKGFNNLMSYDGTPQKVGDDEE